MMENVSLTDPTEEAVDLSAETPQVSDSKAAITAAFATMAAKSMNEGDVTDILTGERYASYFDKIKAGEEDTVRAELAGMKGNELNVISKDLQYEAMLGGDKERTKEAIDLAATFDLDKAKKTVIEQGAAREMVDSGLKDEDRASIAVKAIEEGKISFEDEAQDVLEEAIFTEKLMHQRMDKVGTNIGTLADVAVTLIPGFTAWFNNQNIKTEINPFLTGNDLAEQKASWDGMSLEEKAEAAEGINTWFDSTGNHLNALLFWSYMGNLHDGEIWLENVGTTLDAAVIGIPIAKALKVGKLIQLIAEGKTASSSMVVGNRVDAAAQVEAIEAGVEAGQIARDSDVAIEAAELLVESQLLPDAGLVGLSGRLEESVRDSEKAMDEFLTTQATTFLDPAEQGGLLNASREAHIYQSFDEGKVTSDIAVFTTDEFGKDLTGNLVYRIYYGAEKGRGYPSKETALEAAKTIKLKGVTITPVEANGTYFIQMDRRITKQGDYVVAYDTNDLDAAGGLRRVLASTTNMVDHSTAKAAHLTLATREMATHAGKKLIQTVNKLSKDEKLHLAEVMEEGRNKQKWFSLLDLQRGTYPSYGNALNEKQIAAYHAMRRMDDIEYLVDNSLRYGRLEREGYISAELKSTFAVSKELSEFNAKPVDAIPNPSNKSVFNASTGKYLQNPSVKDIEGLVENNYKVLQLEMARDLKGNHPIQFVVAKAQDLDLKRLNPRQIEYLPGGRLHYSEKFFVKQGRLRNGPGTVPIMLNPKTYGVASMDEATRYAEQMEAGRKMVLAEGSDIDVAKVTGGRFTTVKDYVDHVGEKNLNMPFEVVEDGKDLISVNELIQQGRASALAEDLNMGNSIQRMIRTRGSKQSKRGERLKDFTGDVAPVINPVESARRSLTRATNLISVETWKDKQIGKFHKTFSSVLRGDKTPMLHFLNPEYAKATTPEAKKLIKQAKVMQEHYKRILNTKTQGEVLIQDTLADVVDVVAKRLKISTDTAQKLKDMDPIAFARAITFNEKLGMFNLSQPFVQLHASVLMNTASPIQGPKAVAMTPHLRMMLLSDNPDTMGLLAKAYSRIAPGTDAKVMKEALDVVQRSGSWRLGAGTLAEQDLIKAGGSAGLGSKLLEIGITPFLESERFNKIAGTTASYLEWRKANPTVKITDDVIDHIRTRGEQLVASMNRVDHAAWQRGIAGTVTQFWGYQARLTEMWLPQMMGGAKTFSPAEKFRIALGQLALYGLEGTAGAGTGMLMKEWIRDSYKEFSGEEMNPEALELISDGFVDRMIFTTLGLDVNTHYRVGAGLTETGWGEVATKIATMNWDKLLTIESAPFTTVPENLKGLVHIAKTLSAVNKDLVTQEGFSLALDSVKDFMRKNISSYSRGERAYLAMKTGNYYDSLGRTVSSGISTWEAVGIPFGFDPADAIDVRGMEEAVKLHSKLYDKHVKFLTRAFNEAAINGKPEQFDYTKEIILSTVDNDLDRIDILKKVFSGLKKKDVKVKFLKAFGPEFLDDKEGVE